MPAVSVHAEEIWVGDADEAFVGPLDQLQGRSRRHAEHFVVIEEGHPAWPPDFTVLERYL